MRRAAALSSRRALLLLVSTLLPPLLALIVREIDQLQQIPDWLVEGREDWAIQAREAFDFGVVPDLDRYATSDARRDIVLDLARRALSVLEDLGPVISREWLTALGAGGRDAIFSDAPAELFLRAARYFIKLLAGTLQPEEIDARIFER